jgi:hypothetical protein|tara:strand:- start:419 stop:622 length:204 start_codon:yes stop_codon:yes gene_type:complete
VVAEVITEEVVEPTGRTELEERQNLWNEIQKFNPKARMKDYYDENEWNVEKMRSDLKALLEKERFGR